MHHVDISHRAGIEEDLRAAALPDHRSIANMIALIISAKHALNRFTIMFVAILLNVNADSART